MDALIIESLSTDIARVRVRFRADADFVARAARLLERNKELLDRLAR
jgi:hypothetical protein